MNMLKKNIKILASLLVLLTFASCFVEELESSLQDVREDGFVDVSFSVSVQDTKSAVFTSEEENFISSITIFAYLTKGGDYTNNPFKNSEEGGHKPFPDVYFRKKPVWNVSGCLIAEKTFLSPHDISLSLPRTKENEAIHIYAVANMPELHAPVLERDFYNIVYRYPSASSIGPCIPMVMEEDFKYIEWKIVEIRPGIFRKRAFVERGFKPFRSIIVTAKGTGKITLGMNKAVARYRFRLDNRLASYLRPSSIKLCQAPLVMMPFQRGYKALLHSDVGDGDYGTWQDVSLCEGGQVFFYCLENMQGDIKPFIPGGGLLLELDEWCKEPKYNPEKHNVCTYLELTAFMDGSLDGKVGDVVYRFYLGKDNISNYDVERNTSYDIMLTSTLEGLNRGKPSWRITDERTVFSEEKNLYMAQKLTYPVNAEDVIDLSLSPENSLLNNGTLSIKAVRNHEGRIVGCEVSALAPGFSSVYAKSGGLVKKILDLNVSAPLLKAEKNEVSLFVDGSYSPLSFRYENAQGAELPKSFFAPELYKALLEYDVVTSSDRLSVLKTTFLDQEDYFAYINSFGNVVLASELSGSVEAVPHSAHVAPVTVSLNALEPFPVTVKKIDEPIHDRSLLDGGTYSVIVPMAINAQNVSMRLTRPGMNMNISTSMRFTYRPSDGVIRFVFDGTKKKTNGRLRAVFSVKNMHSGESWKNSEAKCDFTIVVHLKICGRVRIERGTDGFKYAVVSAESSRPDILSPNILLGYLYGRSEGRLGGEIYRTRLEWDMDEKMYKEFYSSGPDLAVVDLRKNYPESHLRMPVVFDMDYMNAHGYFAFNNGGWKD